MVVTIYANFISYCHLFGRDAVLWRYITVAEFPNQLGALMKAQSLENYRDGSTHTTFIIQKGDSYLCGLV